MRSDQRKVEVNSIFCRRLMYRPTISQSSTESVHKFVKKNIRYLQSEVTMHGYSKVVGLQLTGSGEMFSLKQTEKKQAKVKPSLE